MAMIRPSLTLVLDLDERAASEDTVLEIRRSYAHICTPVIHTHAPEDEDAPERNVARAIVNMGTRKYLRSSDEGADALWADVVETWVKNILHKLGNNMKVFNDRQRKIKLPELLFERLDVELQGGEFVVSLHPDPVCMVDEELHAQVGLARTLLNDGVLEGAVRVEIPSDASYAEQRADAWRAWVEEHPEALLPKPEPVPEPKPDAAPELSREEWLARDEEAKSYENTHVAPTDSEALPPIKREEEEEEPEQFDFEVNYGMWDVVYADGEKRAFDAVACEFAGA